MKEFFQAGVDDVAGLILFPIFFCTLTWLADKISGNKPK